MGPWYAELGRGDGATVVDDTPWVARGHSRETTFQRDLTERAQVDDAVRELTARVLEDVVADGRPVVGLTLKVRYAPFVTKTHARKIPETFDRDEILAGPWSSRRNRTGPSDPAPGPAGRNGNARRCPKGTYADSRRLVTASQARSRRPSSLPPRRFCGQAENDPENPCSQS